MILMTGLAVGLAAGCGAGVHDLPSKGGPAWLELKSAHVTLWTDASPKRAKELINELEQRRQVIARAMGRVQQKARIFAIALASEREASEFIPEGFAAFARQSNNPSMLPGLVMRSFDSEDEVTMNHEMAHAVSFSIIDHQPAWLAEGLAMFFEAGTLDPEKGTVEVGIPRRDALVYLRQNKPLPMDKVFTCQELDCRSPEFYASSWALFSYLLNHHYDRFGRYLQRIDQLPSGSHDKVWSEIFPDLTPAKLDSELPGWLYAGAFAVPRIPVEVKSYPFVPRKLSDADVLAMRSLLYWHQDSSEKSRAAALASLSAARTNLLAWLMAARFDQEPTAEETRAISRAEAGDWRAWLLHSAVLGRGAEQDEARQAEYKVAHQRFCELAALEGEACEEWN